jgi:RNA polymerase sigma-B factor
MSIPPRPTKGDPRDRLIESHLPLVRALASRYTGRGETLEDLVQVGAVGLIKASDRFDPDRGVSFSTFATPAVEGEIRRHLGDHTAPVRIPRELRRMTGQLRYCRAKLESSLGRAPTQPELARALGVEERDVERALQAERARNSVSLPQEGGPEVPSAGEPMAESDARVLLERGARVLDERERRIVFLRFHADMTERDIASTVGISQTHVSRLLGGALDKLRKQLAADGDGDIAPEPAISPPERDENRPKAQHQQGTLGKIASVSASQKHAELTRFLARPYHVAVRSDRDQWSAVVEELPGCEARGASADEAVEHLKPVMERWLSVALEEGREIPPPATEGAKRKPAPSHSGRLLLRMPSELHQELSLAAEREHTSLNRFITDVLAASVAEEPPQAAPLDDRLSGGPEPGRSSSSSPVGAPRALRVALATNLIVVVFAGVAALALLVLALQRGI